MSKTDTLPYLIIIINLLYKLLSRFPSKADGFVIAQQMLDGKIKEASEFFGSYLDASVLYKRSSMSPLLIKLTLFSAYYLTVVLTQIGYISDYLHGLHFAA